MDLLKWLASAMLAEFLPSGGDEIKKIGNCPHAQIGNYLFNQ